MMRLTNISVFSALLLICTAGTLDASSIPEQDSRNVILPNGETHFQMPVFTSREAWMTRASDLRKQILASAGLLPLPAKTPLHPQIFSKLEREGYSVEKVLLETYPGFYLGGNLYRPLGKTGPFPAVISPHGHWDYGRLENTAVVSVPGRCINLARQGFVVFTYDMVGHNDTTQLPHGDHGPRMGGAREDLWSISTMGLQLWDSIRAVDFVASLPDVDPGRLAATGASGGGTQTFQLTAVDDRIKISAPVNMISFISQGGGCQEASNLRIDTNNVMFAAMMAPRPLLMVSASGDWTRNTPREEFPAVQRIYRLFDAAQNVEQLQIDSPHNYNQPSREAVYTFFGARLLNLHGPVPEQRYRVEQLQDLLAMYGRARPANAVTMQQYVEDRIAEARQDTDVLRPRDEASLTRAREAFRERLAFSLLASAPLPREVISAKIAALPGGEKLLLGRAGKGDRIPSVWLSPRKLNPDVTPTLIVHSEGVAPILASAETKDGLVKGILDRGGFVLAIDSFQTGSAKAPRDTEKHGFTVYNRTNDANRVQDILTAITYLKERSKSSTVNLIGLENAGVWTWFARALAGSGVNLAADLNRFQTDSDNEFLEKFFVPGVRRAGDFRAAAVLATQGKLLIHNAGDSFPADWVRDSARIGGFPAEVRAGKMSDSELVSWVAPITAKTQSQNPGSTH